MLNVPSFDFNQQVIASRCIRGIKAIAQTALIVQVKLQCLG